MSAPEEEDVMSGVGREDHGCAFGRDALQDVENIVGCECCVAVVDEGSLPEVGSVGVGAYGAFVGVLRCVGAVVGGDEDDVVVGVAVVFQELVDAEYVSLVAIVIPSVAALDEESVLVGERGVVDGVDGFAVVCVESFLGILHEIVPGGERLGCLRVALGAVVALVEDLATADHPVDVGCVEGCGVALAVELHGPGCSFESEQFSALEGGEIKLHAGLAPGVPGDEVVGGADVDNGLVDGGVKVGQRCLCTRFWVVFGVASGKGCQEEGVVEFAFSEGGFRVEAGLVADLESGHGVGIRCESLVAAGEGYASRSEGSDVLFGDIGAGVIDGRPKYAYFE